MATEKGRAARPSLKVKMVLKAIENVLKILALLRSNFLGFGNVYFVLFFVECILMISRLEYAVNMVESLLR